MKILHFGITKPPNSKTDNIDEVPAVIAAPTVWKTEAINRNMDIDVRCIATSIRNWRKNLQNTCARATMIFRTSNQSVYIYLSQVQAKL